MLTTEQIRAARAMLRWGQKRLAWAAELSGETVKRIEKNQGAVAAHAATIDAIRRALERAGIEFTFDDGIPGVKLVHLPAPRRPENPPIRPWQLDAEELRTIAGQSPDPATSAALQRIAQSYERLAASQEMALAAATAARKRGRKKPRAG